MVLIFQSLGTPLSTLSHSHIGLEILLHLHTPISIFNEDRGVDCLYIDNDLFVYNKWDYLRVVTEPTMRVQQHFPIRFVNPPKLDAEVGRGKRKRRVCSTLWFIYDDEVATTENWYETLAILAKGGIAYKNGERAGRRKYKPKPVRIPLDRGKYALE